MWVENVPDLTGLVPEQPTTADSLRAFNLIRETFKTFPFTDAEMVCDPANQVTMVDTSKAPGKDESSFLAALLTAVCRPSLHLAPGVLLRAPSLSRELAPAKGCSPAASVSLPLGASPMP